jgi:hypothetical protein
MTANLVWRPLTITDTGNSVETKGVVGLPRVSADAGAHKGIGRLIAR